MKTRVALLLGSLLCIEAFVVPVTTEQGWSQEHSTRSDARILRSSNDDGDVTTPRTEATMEDQIDGTPSSPQKSIPNIPPPPPMSTSDALAALGTSPRRILLSMASATGIALAGNLFGVTSALLKKFPEESVESSGLDLYFPRGEYKRCRESDYTFVFPKQWVADTYVALAKAQRQTRSLDFDMRAPTKGSSTLPDVAFGPPGRLDPQTGTSSGEINVSVIRTPGLPVGFSLRGTLGEPTAAADTLLKVSLAPPGSGREATLNEAAEVADRPGGSLYQFSYTVDRGSRGPPLRAISVVGVKEASQRPQQPPTIVSTPTLSSSTLVTLTVVAPLKTWEEDADAAFKLQRIADSFHMRN